ncbi:hypothetical protein [Flavobacterium anhuiense]
MEDEAQINRGRIAPEKAMQMLNAKGVNVTIEENFLMIGKDF